ncbi:hypothetical protein AVEN_270702-1 [Araneus ventricosus]|uniref:Uncharacterized protein n=1 Tax=Araneus ventricosus TaxID=182803 RepID=A0A4Y2FF27_ARAVE|nr:hypothetical protein AVEN_270702-1 [Araneus ventricosus]
MAPTFDVPELSLWEICFWSRVFEEDSVITRPDTNAPCLGCSRETGRPKPRMTIRESETALVDLRKRLPQNLLGNLKNSSSDRCPGKSHGYFG